MNRVLLPLLLLIPTGLPAASGSQNPTGQLPTTSGPTPNADPRLDWWRQARLGLFIHWGPVSLIGTELSWSRAGPRPGTGGTGTVPVEVYDHLYQRFNPTQFDAREWVDLARRAGMQYLVFTTKHHDGFCMFDSGLTEYKITRTPFGRDVVKELAEACHQAGLRLGFYYSQPDWHHPDYRTTRHDRYIRYLHDQLRELCSRYGTVDIIWFDGLAGKPEDWDAPALFQIIRQLQPQALINDRAGLPGDFDTPEQQIGPFQKHRPWESCITLGQQWAWKPDDELKSLKECLHTLVRCAGGDGNLLLNVGPMPTGQIEPRQAERLLEMGQWLAQYGQSIYSTRGGPWMPSPWGASTHQANTVYLHLLDWPTQTVKLPPVPATVVASRLLTGGRLELKQSPDGIELTVPQEDRQPIDTIVVLELDRPACDLPPVPWRLASGSLAFGKPAAASNVFRNLAEFGPDRALDDDPQTRWATDYGIYSAWLEVDLGAPTSINQVRIREAVEFGPRVRQFELQYREGETWRTCLRGTEIGDRLIRTFPPITAQHIRLNILEAAEGPTIWEFQLFGPSPGGR